MLQYRPLHVIAYDRLRDMIQNKELEFDTVYSETKLASEFSISRTPMRDALIRLSNERYIDILPNRGFMLHKPTHKDILEAYHVRLALEGYCVQIIAEDHLQPKGQETLSQMASWLERQKNANEAINPDSLVKFWQYDLAFHMCIINYVDLTSFNQQFETFMHFFTAYEVEGYLKMNRNDTTLTEHDEILAALKAGDPARAWKAIRAHLDTALEVTLK